MQLCIQLPTRLPLCIAALSLSIVSPCVPLAPAFLLRPCRLSTATVFVSTSVAAGIVGFLRSNGQALGFTGAASHLVGRIPYYSNQPSLLHDVAHVSVLCTLGRLPGVPVSEMR